MNPSSNVFDWLDSVREHPSMHARSVTELESQVHGYYTALQIHEIRESVPDMTNKFNVWAQLNTGWSGFNCGWGYAFDHNTPKGDDPFQHFFSYVDTYRTLKPIVIARVSLSPNHQPTGKRCVFGFDGRMDRPDEISAINYSPTSLNHLRHQTGSRLVDGWFLMHGDGSYDTSQSDLFDWVSDEFGVPYSAWQIITEHVSETSKNPIHDEID
jgi:hypothetical protein